jgi:hypothetical protein
MSRTVAGAVGVVSHHGPGRTRRERICRISGHGASTALTGAGSTMTDNEKGVIALAAMPAPGTSPGSRLDVQYQRFGPVTPLIWLRHDRFLPASLRDWELLPKQQTICVRLWFLSYRRTNNHAASSPPPQPAAQPRDRPRVVCGGAARTNPPDHRPRPQAQTIDIVAGDCSRGRKRRRGCTPLLLTRNALPVRHILQQAKP